MREPVSGHIICKLASALEQQIIFNTANVFAAAEGANAASAGIDVTCGRGLSYCVQDDGPRGEKGAANIRFACIETRANAADPQHYPFPHAVNDIVPLYCQNEQASDGLPQGILV